MSSAHTVDLIEAARIMQCHPKTVEAEIKSGALRAGKIGRAWVMLRQDVHDLVEQRIIAQTSARLLGKASSRLGAGKAGTARK